jgi:hypothetical protein
LYLVAALEEEADVLGALAAFAGGGNGGGRLGWRRAATRRDDEERGGGRADRDRCGEQPRARRARLRAYPARDPTNPARDPTSRYASPLLRVEALAQLRQRPTASETARTSRDVLLQRVPCVFLELTGSEGIEAQIADALLGPLLLHLVEHAASCSRPQAAS